MRGTVAKRIRKAVRAMPEADHKKSRLVRVNQEGTIKWTGYRLWCRLFKQNHHSVPRHARSFAYDVAPVSQGAK